MTRIRRTLAATLALSLSLPCALSSAAAQSPQRPSAPPRGAVELQRLVAGLTVTPRVLVVGMHPDDEPSELLAWLSRGRHIETAYLSVTRGEAGQNLLGPESGSTLGAIRVHEALAARRIDGAHQFFTRAYDFGIARSADEVFRTWVRDSVVADVVTVIRAFRPQVMISVFPDSITDGNGQHMALATILDHAFTSSADPARFPARRFGAPWPVAKLYRQGRGIRIETAEYDRMLGVTYAELGLQARAQQRSQGLFDVSRLPETAVAMQRVASRVNADHPDTSLFDGVDTTLFRLSRGVPASDTALVARLAALADSVRVSLDLARPDAAVPALSRLVRITNDLRRRATRCRHPSRDTRPTVDSVAATCGAAALDADASIDLLHERATDALLVAAGVSIETVADRELVAGSDTATVMVTISNRGRRPFAVFSVELLGAVGDPVPGPGKAITLAPDSTRRLFIRVAGLSAPAPWWIASRVAERFDPFPASPNGATIGGLPIEASVPNIAVPDDLRRSSDVTIMVDVEGTTVRTSLGPVVHRYADAQLGLQNRELAGVPDVAFRFNRGLTWVPLGRSFTRVLRVGVKSFTDKPLLLGIGKLAPPGVNVDSIPKQITLEGREQRDIAVPLRGRLTEPRRKPFAIWGVTETGATYQQGFQTIERDYLPPIRVFRTSGVWMQPVDVTIPRNLTVLYVPEASDDVRSALSEIGVMAREISPEALLMTDLSRVSTVAIASRALERHPELLAQAGRLTRFVRDGGTLVIQRGTRATATSPLLPYPMTVARAAEKVVSPDAPVTALDPAARVLTWPNRITSEDWDGWVSGRAEGVPSTVDPRYSRIIETHDPNESANRNTLLVARVGKGTIVYTTLTLDDQIAGGVPGALRLMVNLLSAGLPR